MSFIAKNPLTIPEIETTPPSPEDGARGLFAKNDGFHEIDSDGNTNKIATENYVDEAVSEATGVDTSNFVTLDGEQTISGDMWFTGMAHFDGGLSTTFLDLYGGVADMPDPSKVSFECGDETKTLAQLLAENKGGDTSNLVDLTSEQEITGTKDFNVISAQNLYVPDASKIVFDTNENLQDKLDNINTGTKVFDKIEVNEINSENGDITVGVGLFVKGDVLADRVIANDVEVETPEQLMFFDGSTLQDKLDEASSSGGSADLTDYALKSEVEAVDDRIGDLSVLEESWGYTPETVSKALDQLNTYNDENYNYVDEQMAINIGNTAELPEEYLTEGDYTSVVDVLKVVDTKVNTNTDLIDSNSTNIGDTSQFTDREADVSTAIKSLYEFVDSHETTLGDLDSTIEAKVQEIIATLPNGDEVSY